MPSNSLTQRMPAWRRLLPVIAGAALLFALWGASTASAYDGSPCHHPRNRTFTWHGYSYPNTTVMTCPLWRGKVPVYEWSSSAAPVVGYLRYGGNANWFVAEKWSNYYALGRSVNHYWASTMADNGQWGWVPEVFFSGGRNDEDDRGLLLRPPLTCGGSCKPIPPWYQ